MLDKVTKFRLECFIDYLDKKDSRVKGLRIKFDDNFIYLSGHIKALENEYVLNEVFKINEYIDDIYNNEIILSYLIDDILKRISTNIDVRIEEKYYAR